MYGKHSSKKSRQRFSLRKLSVGTASVLIGTLIFLGQNESVAADNTASTDKSSALVTSGNSSGDTEQADQASTTTTQADASADLATDQTSSNSTTPVAEDSATKASESEESSASTADTTDADKASATEAVEDKSSSDSATATEDADTTETTKVADDTTATASTSANTASAKATATEKADDTATAATATDETSNNAATSTDAESTNTLSVNVADTTATNANSADTLRASKVDATVLSNLTTSNDASSTGKVRRKRATTDTDSSSTSDDTYAGYSVSIPDQSNGVLKDPEDGRFTFNNMKNNATGSTYVFSVKDAASIADDDVADDKESKEIYVTVYDKDGTVTKQFSINRFSGSGVKETLENTTFSLLDDNSIQLNETDPNTTYTNSYSALSSSSDNKNSTYNLVIPRLIDQKTDYYNLLTDESIKDTYKQTAWQGYDYTTTPIEIDGYRYVKSTNNESGTVSVNQPRFKGSVSYRKVQTTVAGAKITLYIKATVVDTKQTLSRTVYMTPSTSSSLPDAETFFTNISDYTTYTDKIYTPVTDLTAKSSNGNYTYSDVAANDANAFYLARTDGKYFSSSSSSSSVSVTAYKNLLDSDKTPVTYKVTFMLPYADKTMIAADSVGNKATLNNAITTFSDVRYYYIPQGSVEVTYVNTDGETIKDTLELVSTQDIGTESASVVTYNTYDATGETAAPTTITTADGKTYELAEEGVYEAGAVDSAGHLTTSAATTGDLALGKQTVTYVYKEVKGNVNVTYVDTEGNTIHTTVVDTQNASTGTAYDTSDNKPATITTADGKTYELVSAGEYTVGTVDAEGHLTSSDATTGEVAVGTKTVTYVYQEVKGTVTVHYVDEDGTVLKDPVIDTPESSTGTAYDTTDNKPATITTADGKTYELVPELTSGQETGTVVPGNTDVTYVYKEVKGNVNVTYVDTEGNTIHTTVVDTQNASTGTAYDTSD
ncbi:MucBP domain-containing protein, partial [Streptococcus sciuri]